MNAQPQADLRLLYDCAVHACTNPVTAPGQPCRECQMLFGPLIQKVS